MNRSPSALLILLAGLLALLLSIGIFASGKEFHRTVTVNSTPSGADIYLDGRYIGETPARATLSDNAPHELRLVRKGYDDAQALLEPINATHSSWRNYQYTQDKMVTLTVSAIASMRVTSTPSGCDVYLDGLRVGVTPLTLSELAATSHMVQVKDPNGDSVSKEVDLRPGELTTVDMVPPDMMAAVYREDINKSPKDLLPYCDLAHHLTIKGKFSDAMDVLNEGLAVCKQYPSVSTGMGGVRFRAEIDHIYTGYFDYPAETEGNRIRPALRELVENAIKEKVPPEQGFRDILRRMDTEDRKPSKGPAK